MSYRCAQSFEFSCLFTLIALVILSKIIRYYLYADDLNFISLAQPSLLNLSHISNCHLVFPHECQIGISESIKLTLDLVFSALLIFPDLSVVKDKKNLEFIFGSSLPLKPDIQFSSRSHQQYLLNIY